jgi:hypothetical protein
VQNAKDTFYVTLQERLATLNPSRTVVVRGVIRPGIVVDENELYNSEIITDVFRLEWSKLQVDSSGPLPLATMECAIYYATDGTPGNCGMDRGRLLAAMDAELAAALATTPHHAEKINYSGAGPGVSPLPMGTNVFWGDPMFGPVVSVDERLERAATVQIFAYQEAGEM